MPPLRPRTLPSGFIQPCLPTKAPRPPVGAVWLHETAFGWFRVAVVQFMDRFNFCLAGVKRSCIHFVTPNGQIIPFDTYNLFYRNDRVAGIRADLATAHRETSA
jgi:hypothetical protein